MFAAGSFKCSSGTLVYIQQRFRYKLLRGYLPWNKWDPKSFRRAVYKYIDEEDYQKMRNPDWVKANPQIHYNDLKNIDYSIQEIQKTNPNKPNIHDYKRLNIHYNMSNVPSPWFKGKKYQSRERLYDAKQYNIYKFEEKYDTEKNYESFQPDLWVNYAYKTFTIDRTQHGGLPVSTRYKKSNRQYYMVINRINGSVDDFTKCLQAYLGKDAELIQHTARVYVYGRKYFWKTRNFLKEMGF